MDDFMVALLEMIRQEGGAMSCDDDRLEQFADIEDENGDDAINRLINAGLIRQTGCADWGENFRLEIVPEQAR
jgi:hypothetical protein